MKPKNAQSWPQGLLALTPGVKQASVTQEHLIEKIVIFCNYCDGVELSAIFPYTVQGPCREVIYY